MIVASKHRVE